MGHALINKHSLWYSIYLSNRRIDPLRNTTCKQGGAPSENDELELLDRLHLGGRQIWLGCLYGVFRLKCFTLQVCRRGLYRRRAKNENRNNEIMRRGEEVCGGDTRWRARRNQRFATERRIVWGMHLCNVYTYPRPLHPTLFRPFLPLPYAFSFSFS